MGGACLLHSEVVGSKAGIVDVEDQAGVVGSGVKHLERVLHTHEKNVLIAHIGIGHHCALLTCQELFFYPITRLTKHTCGRESASEGGEQDKRATLFAFAAVAK